MNNIADFLPKTIDYKMDRYNLKVIHYDDDITISEGNERVKLYYRSKNQVLSIRNVPFCKEGYMYQATYDMLCLIEEHMKSIIVSSDDITDFESYVGIINNLSENLNSLGNAIRRGDFSKWSIQRTQLAY